MTSQLYTPAKVLFMSAGLNLPSDTLKVAAVNITADYTFSAAHQFLTDITAYSGATAQTLASKAVTAGVLTAAEITFAALAASGTKTVGALVLYKDTGVAGTSPLIAYLTDGITAVLPNGGDITTSGFTTKVFNF